MPLNRDIVGRFLGLHQQMNDKKLRIKNIAVELIYLWNKLNFSVLSEQRVMSKITLLVDAYVKYRKRKSDKFVNELLNVFDITKLDGNWLSMEDKELYQKQIESQGAVGYTTAKLAPVSTIHPSKRRRVDKLQCETVQCASDVSDESGNDSEIKMSVDHDFSPEEKVSKNKVCCKTCNKFLFVNKTGIKSLQNFS